MRTLWFLFGSSIVLVLRLHCTIWGCRAGICWLHQLVALQSVAMPAVPPLCANRALHATPSHRRRFPSHRRRRCGSGPGLWPCGAPLTAGALPCWRPGHDRQWHPLHCHISWHGRCRLVLGSIIAAGRFASCCLASAAPGRPPPDPQPVVGRAEGRGAGRVQQPRAATARRLCASPLQDVQVRIVWRKCSRNGWQLDNISAVALGLHTCILHNSRPLCICSRHFHSLPCPSTPILPAATACRR